MESSGYVNGHSKGYTEDVENGKPIHLLMVPMVMQAHAVTAIRFAKKLSKRGVTVTMVMIKQHADQLYRIYTREALQKLGLYIECLDTYQSPQIPMPVTQSVALQAAIQPIAEKLIAKKKAGLPVPTCLLADRFLPWIDYLAKELDIPRYSYASNAAITTRLMQVYYELEDELRAIPDGPDRAEKCYQLLRKKPGLEFVKKVTDIPDASYANGWFDFVCNIGRGFSNTDGIVFNSFYSLEHETIESIRNAYPDRTDIKVAPVYPIGPLSTIEEFRNETFVVGVEDSHSECVEWLGTQSPQSVLYICLGSQGYLVGEQILHLARALEASHHSFLWVLAKGRGNFNTVDEVLPPGYLERVCGRGKIVSGWVGQLEILSNPAIGGFLSHCGWQSTIESLTCGVPILGWPQGAEQSLNCRYVEDVMKVGLRVTEKVKGTLVEQQEFEEAVKSFMSEKGRSVIAANAARVKEMAAAAVAEGGLSDVALDQLVQSFSGHKKRH